MPTTTREIEPGEVLAERELHAITGELVPLPHPERLTQSRHAASRAHGGTMSPSGSSTRRTPSATRSASAVF